MSRMSWDVLLNLFTCWCLLEAWAAPPRGFYGSPTYVLICHLVCGAAVVLLTTNLGFFIADKLAQP